MVSLFRGSLTAGRSVVTDGDGQFEILSEELPPKCLDQTTPAPRVAVNRPTRFGSHDRIAVGGIVPADELQNTGVSRLGRDNFGAVRAVIAKGRCEFRRLPDYLFG